MMFLAMMACAVEPTAKKTDVLTDYVYRLPLTMVGKQGVVTVRLPPAVYLHAKSASLNDVRVFDANGVRMPFSLYRPSTHVEVKRQHQPVTIFPVTGHANIGDVANLDLDIRTQKDGSVVSVKTKNVPEKPTTGATLTSLVLDIGKTEHVDTTKISALRFTLPPKHGNYAAQIWVESSDDLQNWETLGAAELSWLTNSDGVTISNDALKFTPRKFRYARLTWGRGAPLQFAHINAEWISTKELDVPTETLWFTAQPGQQAGDWAYTVGIAIPAEQISLRLPPANIVLPVEIGEYQERPNPKNRHAPSQWVFQAKARATFYQITQNHQTRRSGALPIPPTHQAQWVIRPLHIGDPVLLNNEPELGLSWQPASLIFLAAGSAPYTLAFGRDDADPAAVALTQVAPGFKIEEIKQLEQAGIGALQTYSQATPSEPPSTAVLAGLSAQQRHGILWAVLLLGVAVLVGLTWRLFKQMKG